MSNNKRRSVKRRRGNSVFGIYRRSVFMISLIMLLLAVMVGIRCVSLLAKNREYISREAELEAQIEAQNQRAEELDEFREYVKSAEYEKEIAQEKLGLVDPDEIIFKASD